MSNDADINALTIELPDRAGDFALSLIPWPFNLIPALNSEVKKKAAAAAASQAADKSSPLYIALNWLSGILGGAKGMLLGWWDNSSLIARNNMMARIGLNADGETTSGANPLAAIDAQLGIDNAAAPVQAILSRQIYAATGYFGMANPGIRDKETIQIAMNARDDVYKAYLSALKTKYGTGNVTALETIAHRATDAVLGAGSSQTAESLIYSPPANGFIALVSNTQMNTGHAVAALSIGNEALKTMQKALTDLKRPQATAQAQAQAQAEIEGANARSLPSADITGQFSVVPLAIRFGNITEDNLSGFNLGV